jgi:hypothetical protein
MNRIDVPFSRAAASFWQAAARLLAGSRCVQLGGLACCLG